MVISMIQVAKLQVRPIVLGLLTTVAMVAVGSAQQDSVADTVHNLSVSGPGEIKAVSETEICKFCHIPHTAMAETPLWGHTLSEVDYAVPDIRRGDRREPSPPPDGSSRLCLSCHDGTVALGDISGLAQPLAMVGGDRLRSGQSGFLGTDLTGDHPISFVLRDDALGVTGDRDIGVVPLSAIQEDDDVNLDADGKMQCTTCHDPHSDRNYVPGRVPRFWVKSTVNEVCLTCHVLR